MLESYTGHALTVENDYAGKHFRLSHICVKQRKGDFDFTELHRMPGKTACKFAGPFAETMYINVEKCPKSSIYGCDF